ncbi:MAG: Gfo/Idh/MocA family oxidoreductase [Methylococcales bacterium]|nr:Gfo/Idh/MocA family oxidoreductase [Methylococcales bacterium]
MTTKLNCAVIGAGYLGKFHAQKYAQSEHANLLAVVDSHPDTALAIASAHGCRAETDYRAILKQVDAVSIVVPTSLHYAIAKDCLDAGVHVLVEKPMTVSLEEADDLIARAEHNGVCLAVGHLERFNPAVLGLGDNRETPLFIESHRLSPFNPRANDVSVVLDLMIHDIDIILALVDSKVERIDASGGAVLTSGLDIANARLNFAGGCVANVTASRISLKSERKMRLFRPSCYESVDFQNRILTRHRTGDKEMFPGVPEIISEESVYPDADALNAEIRDFIDAILSQRPPKVTGHDGRKALETALAITRMIC